MNIKLWHCQDARSLRPLWMLEELQLDYELALLDFPPRIHDPEFVELNVLGTVPYMTVGDASMTESSAMCQFLAAHFPEQGLGVEPHAPAYADYLNWLFHSDATLTFPLTLVLRYGTFEPEQRRQQQVVEDYTQWYLARLKRLNQHLVDNQYLCESRFTAADVAIGYALFLGEMIGLAEHFKPQTRDYLYRLKQRPAFERARARGQGRDSALGLAGVSRQTR